MENKIYRFYGINSAIEMLRPGAVWEWTGGVGFTRWEDTRLKPTQEEIEDTMEKIKAFEDSIKTVWTEEQLKQFGEYQNQIETQ